MMLTGHPIHAAGAARLNLVNRVLPAGDLLPAARAVATRIANNGPIAVRQAKKCLNMARETGFSAGWAYEQEAYQAVIPTEDRTEALSAFPEKRQTLFLGQG